MDHVLAFRAWPAAPNASVIFPISSVLGGCSRCPTASPAMGFFAPAGIKNPPKIAGKKVLLTYI
jgi:hypothetical protein